MTILLTLLIVVILLVVTTLWSKKLRNHLRLGLDLLDLVRLLITLRLQAFNVRHRDWSVVDMFEDCVALHGDDAAIAMAEPVSSISYSELDRRSNQIARWALQQRLGKGDAIALVMPSCPDYVAIWLGLAKVGVCTALVNIHTKGPPLVHAIRTVLCHSNSKVVVVDHSLVHNLLSPDVLSELGQGVRVVTYGVQDGESPDEDMAQQIISMNKGPLSRESRQGIRASVPWRVHHVHDLLPDQRPPIGQSGLSPGDLVVSWLLSFVLPLTTFLGTSNWYLVNSRPTPADKECRIRVAFGNGLSPDVWNKFKERYCVSRVVEFYASTEGNVNMVNNTGKVGAVGVVPWFAERLYPICLLRMDAEMKAPCAQAEREKLARGDDRLCIQCRPGEVGQVVGLINNHDPARRFDGYTDNLATSRKIVRHVRRVGDTYFASGDLLRKDAFGFYYWVDRIGDTYRWKGENVATTEVAQVMCSFPGIADVNVYGVSVPGTEGCVGMAAIKLKGIGEVKDFNWQALFQHLNATLPTYAQPQFLRLSRQPSLTAHMTTTFKHIKTQLRKEGFNLDLVHGDSLLFRDDVLETFVPLKADLHAAICSGKLRI